MFAGCSRLKELNLNGWDFSEVLNADYMFAWCDILRGIVANFNFKVVNDVSSMFDGCLELDTIDLTNADLSNVKDLSYMFFNCESLTNVSFNQTALAKAENINYMFYNCSSLNKLVMPNLDFSTVKHVKETFKCCNTLKEIYIKKLVGLSRIKKCEMLKDCKAKVWQL